MLRAFGRFGSGWLVFAGALSMFAGCGDDESPPQEAKDAGERDAGGQMMVPTGGRGGRGGRGGSGGGGSGGGTGPDPSAYACVPKPGDTGGSKESGAECCDGLGTCSAETGGGNAGLPHETCKAQPDLRCVPKPPVNDEDGGSANFASCRVQFPGAPQSAPSFEGRCLPSCFVRYSPIASRLSQATCDAGEICSPCYDPLTGRSTGTCERPGDSPIDPPLPGFTECENGLGYCVPVYAAGGAADNLSQLTCPLGELCAPKNKVADPGACFERCSAGEFGPGACAPMSLAGPSSPFLESTGCRTGELCIPCVALGTVTGVCE